MYVRRSLLLHSPKLSRREEVAGPLFNLIQRHVKPRTDHTTLVQTSIQVDYNFPRSMVVDYLEFTNVAYMDMGKKCILFNAPHTNVACRHTNSKTVKRSHSPCFIITVRNLTITLEQGLISTCLLPRFSALHIATRASFNTLIRTMAAKERHQLIQYHKTKLVSKPW